MLITFWLYCRKELLVVRLSKILMGKEMGDFVLQR